MNFFDTNDIMAAGKERIFSNVDPELKRNLRRRKKRFKKSLRRLGYSIRDAAKEPFLRAAHLLDMPVETQFRLMSTTRGRAVIRVSLSQVRTFIPNEKLKDKFVNRRVNVFGNWHFFWDGDWDQQVLSIDEHYEAYSTSYRSMMQRLKHGMDYRQCDEFKEKLERLRREGISNRGETLQELENYFKNLARLEDTIAREGYKTQKELGGYEFDEIGVFVGRDGSLIKPVDKFHGTHRFSIARHLGLETIPVWIAAVHSEWGKAHFDLLLEGGEKLQNYFSKQDRETNPPSDGMNE